MSAMKLSPPPTALMTYEAREMSTAIRLLPVRSENMGVSPRALTAAAAISGPSATARIEIVPPSSTNTASICLWLAPLLRSSAISPRCCSTSSDESVTT